MSQFRSYLQRYVIISAGLASARNQLTAGSQLGARRQAPWVFYLAVVASMVVGLSGTPAFASQIEHVDGFPIGPYPSLILPAPVLSIEHVDGVAIGGYGSLVGLVTPVQFIEHVDGVPIGPQGQ